MEWIGNFIDKIQSRFILTLFFFSHFFKTAFIYETLFVFGDTDITVYLILIILFSIILAIKFFKCSPVHLDLT